MGGDVAVVLEKVREKVAGVTGKALRAQEQAESAA